VAKMPDLRFRQIHLDFHTSPWIKDVGFDFDAREFHHQVLQTGSVPLKLLESAIDRWIAEKSAEK